MTRLLQFLFVVVVAILVQSPSADARRMKKKQRRLRMKKKNGGAAPALPSGGYRLWMVEDGPTLVNPKTTLPTIAVTQKE